METATIESATCVDEAEVLTGGAPLKGHRQPVGSMVRCKISRLRAEIQRYP
jgi:hypothetical protein